MTDFVPKEINENTQNTRNSEVDEIKLDSLPTPSDGIGTPEVSLFDSVNEQEDKGNDETKNEDWRQLQQQRAEINRQKRELFDNEEITASAVQKEIGSIFDKLQKRIRGRVTIMSIEHYRRKKLRKVRLLQDDESLYYLFEQLSRYITFNAKAMKRECDLNLLKEILHGNIKFGDDYEIDEETIPKMVTKNDKYIDALYDHLKRFYEYTDFMMDHHKHSEMTVGDALSIIILYQRAFGTMRHRIIDSADEYVVNQDIFCKFVDPAFRVDAPLEKWSNRTKAAVNLYQSVLDHQQNFVTLGQVRQTIDMLISQLIEGMGAGKVSRLMNHIGKKVKEDTRRCASGQRTIQKGDRANERGDQFKRISTKARMSLGHSMGVEKAVKSNPSLKFELIRGKYWSAFVAEITDHFTHDVKSRTVYEKEFGVTASDDDSKDAQFEAVLDMTHFDIASKDKEHEVKSTSAHESKRTRLRIFDTMLSEGISPLATSRLSG